MLAIALTFLVTSAALTLALVFFAPRTAIPLERRRPYLEESNSVLTRFAGTAADSLDRYLSGKNVRLFTKERLENAGLRLSQSDFFILIFVGGTVGFLAGLVVAGPLLAILLLLIAPLVAHFAVKFLTSKRQARFDAQLGDTLQLLTGSLRAGHSILRAIDAAATESAAPTSEEMRRVVAETSLGKDLLSTLNDTASRMENEDFVWIAQAIQINREVGGNLAEVLDQVGDTIRERSEIKGQIASLAAEGKFSAYILLALPFGVIAMLMLISPGYMDPLFGSVIGWALIGTSVVLMVIGTLWLRKIIDLKF